MEDLDPTISTGEQRFTRFSATPRMRSPGTSSLPTPKIVGKTLVIEPFRLQLHQQTFVLGNQLEIDLAALRRGWYQILAVQDFWSEDASPDLDESIAGVFLARRRADGRWEAPESWPVECRSLVVLGYLSTQPDGPL